MNIAETQACNRFNLRLVSRYLRYDLEIVLSYYDELLSDPEFLADINVQFQAVRNTYGFNKAIFRMEHIDSVDWFAFERILLYVMVRLRRPARVLETGVYYGGNTAFILKALERNGEGHLDSIDLPDSTIRASGEAYDRHPMVGDSELYTNQLRPGFLVPENLRSRWTLTEGDSLSVIPRLTERYDLYLHDSDHAMSFMFREMSQAYGLMNPGGIMIADDVDWSNAFHAFVVKNNLYPLFLTDNGKDDLRVRMGLIDLGHPWANISAITGEKSADAAVPCGAPS